jgi:hypothetical protein
MSENRVIGPGNEEKSHPAQNPITAIDILLEPDATMIKQAEAANAGLLRNSSRVTRWTTNISRTSRSWEATYLQPIWKRYSSLLMGFWPPRRY